MLLTDSDRTKNQSDCENFFTNILNIFSGPVLKMAKRIAGDIIDDNYIMRQGRSHEKLFHLVSLYQNNYAFM